MSDLFSKENIALLGVIILFLWRIIDSFIKAKKKREYELEKLAFDMAKYKYSDDDDFEKSSLFSYYLFYLDALENNMRPSYESYEIIQEFDEQFNRKIKRLEHILEKLNSIEKRLDEKHDITINDLWDKNITINSWWSDSKVLLKKIFQKKKTIFRSLS